eukprot:873054-Pleurochrysis_carterae.AAC.1
MFIQFIISEAVLAKKQPHKCAHASVVVRKIMPDAAFVDAPKGPTLAGGSARAISVKQALCSANSNATATLSATLLSAEKTVCLQHRQRARGALAHKGLQRTLDAKRQWQLGSHGGCATRSVSELAVQAQQSIAMDERKLRSAGVRTGARERAHMCACACAHVHVRVRTCASVRVHIC